MRLLPVATFALSLLATASSSFAQDPQPSDASSSSTATPPKKKKAPKKKAKKVAEPAPAPAPTPAKTEISVSVAASTTPAPTPVTQPAPMQPDPGAAANEPPPVSKTSTTSAVITSPADKDRVEKRESEPLTGFGVAPLVGISGFGLGVGGRAGYTFSNKLYVGGQFMYHFGSDTIPGESVHTMYPSLEVGYDLEPARNIVIRPYAGAGMAFTSVSLSGYTDSTLTGHSNSVVIYPGCNVTYTIPKTPMFVGGDIRLVFAPQYDSSTTIGLFASVGARF